MQNRFISWRLSMDVFSKTMLFTTSKTRNVRGFTLLELIVASAVALTILGISLGMLSEQRRWVLGDRTRVTANDNLRLASDLIGQDIKQAGERLEANTQLPGVSIIPGTLGAPSTLILQRQLLSETLPVCQSINAGSTNSSIDVSVLNGVISGTDYGSAIANCTYSYTAPTGGELSTTLTTLRPTENLRSWRKFRCTQEGPAAINTDPCTSTNSATAWAYIYQQDSVGLGHGEFFQYSTEVRDSCLSSTSFPAPSSRTCLKIRRTGSSPWKYTYTYNPNGNPNDTSQPRIFLLEERQYSAILDDSTSRTDDYILQLSVNRQTPKRIANQVSNFQAWAKVPTSYNSVPFSAPARWGCNAGGAAATAPNSTAPNQWYCTGFNNIVNADPDLKLQYINDWQDLQGVRITLSGINPNDSLLKVDTTSANNVLKLSSEFFPRNVTSR
jgi:hypothetical protein